MAIQDSNPERRNLTVLSFSIIVYYLAGGMINDDSVRLQIVNVTFTKPEVLAIFVWALLFWFCFRYWLVHQGSWRKGFFEEIMAYSDSEFIYYNYIVKKFDLNDNYQYSYYPNKHYVKIVSDDTNKIFFQYHNRNTNNDRQIQSREVRGFKDKTVVVLCALFLFFRRPSLSGYFIPYMFFAWAVGLGVSSLF